MTELTEYLIELGRMLGIDTDTEGCVNPNLALSARIVLAIGELEQKAKCYDEISSLQKYQNEMSAWRRGDSDEYPKMDGGAEQ